MKKISIILAILMLMAYALFAMASGESSTTDEGDDTPVKDEATAGDDSAGESAGESADGSEKAEDSTLGKYSVTIDGYRLSYDYEGKTVIIIKYTYTNVSNDTPTAFMIALSDSAFQGGVGLNKSYFVDDSAGYSADNQSKEIKKGASIEVEVAYELNDATTEVDVEVSELISFSDKVITKTFAIAG